VKTDSEFLLFESKKFPWERRVNGDGDPQPFDLFTCPSVSRENGNLVVKSCDDLIIDDSLPLYLDGIRNKPYRLRLEGYTQGDKKSNAMVMIRDIETNEYAECPVGDRCGALNIRVKSLEVRQIEKGDAYEEVPVVKIYDEIVRTELVLTNEQKFLDGENIVAIKDVKGNEYVIKNIGETVKIGEAECTLRSFNKKDGTAKILLRDAYGQEFHKTLHLIH
jgi:hypothetical protein